MTRLLSPPRRSAATALALLAAALLTALAVAAPGAQAAKLRKLASFDQPVYATGAPGFRKLVFVVEQQGTVRVLKGGRKRGRPFLDIRGLVNFDRAERGLLSIAFPPDYKASGRFYVDFTDDQGDLNVMEFRRRSATRARRGSGRLVLEIPHRANANHNGGQLQFLDQLLFISTGDGGGGGDPQNNAQSLDSLLGKVLRIDPRPAGGAPYSVPSSNPFVGRPGRDEIYSYGLRNPWRFSFDTGGADGAHIAIGDAGQDSFEEVDYTTVAAAAGANFGWDALEGFGPYGDGDTPDPGGTTPPIFAYGTHSDGNCTLIGGYVVRDPRLGGLRGRYLYADFCAGNLRSFVPGPRRAKGDRRLGIQVESPSAFGEDTRHRIYVCSLEGPVYRLVSGR